MDQNEMTKDEVLKVLGEKEKILVFWEHKENLFGHAIFGFTGVEAMGIIEILKPKILEQIENLSEKNDRPK